MALTPRRNREAAIGITDRGFSCTYEMCERRVVSGGKSTRRSPTLVCTTDPRPDAIGLTPYTQSSGSRTGAERPKTNQSPSCAQMTQPLFSAITIRLARAGSIDKGVSNRGAFRRSANTSRMVITPTVSPCSVALWPREYPMAGASGALVGGCSFMAASSTSLFSGVARRVTDLSRPFCFQLIVQCALDLLMRRLLTGTTTRFQPNMIRCPSATPSTRGMLAINETIMMVPMTPNEVTHR